MYPKLILQIERAKKTVYKDMLDDEAMCHAILPHVDGVNVFPKLAVYVWLYEKKWSKNAHARDSSKIMEVTIQQLHKLI